MDDLLSDLIDWLADSWGGRIVVAAFITFLIWGAVHIYRAGVREMENEPPQVVVDKSHTVRSYSCGQNCVTNSDYWTLLSAEGETCDVSRKEYAFTKVGDSFKCTQLFGWHN